MPPIRVALQLQDAGMPYTLWALPLAHAEPELTPALERDHGILWGVQDNPDITWVCSRLPITTPGPLILQNTNDTATLTQETRQAAPDPRVRAIVSVAKLMDPAGYNSRYGQGPLQHMLTDSLPWLDQQTIDKIIAPWSWLHQAHMRYLLEDQSMQPRTVDIMFIGGTQYNAPVVTAHRQAALAAVMALPSKHQRLLGIGYNLLPLLDYFKLLWQSKIVLSPWGWGETCMRDFEALMAGCILIKPRTEGIYTLPDYHLHPACRFCAPDFSDLASVVENTLARQVELLEQAADARQQLCASYRVPLADRVAGVVKFAMGVTDDASSSAGCDGSGLTGAGQSALPEHHPLLISVGAQAAEQPVQAG